MGVGFRQRYPQDDGLNSLQLVTVPKAAQKHYRALGLAPDYIERFIR